jgi:hypothetical protein
MFFTSFRLRAGTRKKNLCCAGALFTSQATMPPVRANGYLLFFCAMIYIFACSSVEYAQDLIVLALRKALQSDGNTPQFGVGDGVHFVNYFCSDTLSFIDNFVEGYEFSERFRDDSMIDIGLHMVTSLILMSNV